MPLRDAESISYADRLRETRIAEGAPRENPSTASMSIDELDSLLSQFGSVGTESTLRGTGMVIDPQGFFQLCLAVYRSIEQSDPRVQKQLSEPEFLLYCSWYLTRRVLDISIHLSGLSILGYDEWRETLLDDTELPTPICEYLNQLGALRLPNGQLTWPTLVLPSFRDNTVPAVFETGYQQMDGFPAIRSMMPFSFLKSAIQEMARRPSAEHFLPFVFNVRAYTNSDVLNKAICDYKLWALPNVLNPISKERIGRLSVANFGTNGPFSALVCFSPQIHSDALGCLRSWREIIHMSRIPTTTGGQSTMCVAAIPKTVKNAQIPADRFDFTTSVTVTDYQMQLARIFRYRRNTPANLRMTTDVSGIANFDQFLTYGDCDFLCPDYVKGDSTVLTGLASVKSCVDYYVSLFKLK